MATQDQLANLGVEGGVREDVGADALEAPALKGAKNAVYRRTGEVEKRFGYSRVASSYPDASARMFEHDGQLVSIMPRAASVSGGDASIAGATYSTTKDEFALPLANGTTGIVELGIPRVRVKQIADEVGRDEAPDVVTYNGYRVICWCRRYTTNNSTNLSEVVVGVWDENASNWISEPSTIYGAGVSEPLRPHVGLNDAKTYFVLTYWSGSATDIIYGHTLSTSAVSGNWSSGVDLTSATAVCEGGEYDMDVSDMLYLIWLNAAGGLAYVAAYPLSALTLLLTVNFAATTGQAVAIAASLSKNSLYVGYNTVAPSTFWRSLNISTLATIGGPTAISAGVTLNRMGINILSSTQAFIVAGRNTGTYDQTVVLLANSGGTVQYQYTRHHVLPLSKPIISGTQAYALVFFPYKGSSAASSTNVQFGSSYVMKLDVGTSSALRGYVQQRALPDDALTRVSCHLPRASVSNLSQYPQYVTAIPSWSDLNDARRNGVSTCEVWLSGTTEYEYGKTCSLGRLSLIGGALPTVYDGKNFHEAGFAWDPFVVSAPTNSNTAAGAMALGNYAYAFVWKRTFADGSVSRSAPWFSNVITLAGAGNDTIVWTIPQLAMSLTEFSDDIHLEVYRTTVGGTLAGPYYRLTFEPSDSVIAVDAISQTVSFSDIFADANISAIGTVTLSTRPQIYTTGANGERLPNDPPPYGQAVTQFDNRWWIGHGNELWFTQELEPGTVPAFSSENVIRLPASGEIVAMDSMDGRLVVFTEETTFGLTGSGPAPNGDGATYSYPNEIHAALGCVSNRSVCVTPEGIMFATDGGRLMLLTRSLEYAHIGMPVQTTIDSYASGSTPVIWTSAQWLQDAQEVRVTFRNQSGLGEVLTYNLRAKAWTTFQIKANGSSTGVSTAATANGTYYAGAAAFTNWTMKEKDATSTTAYLDDTSIGGVYTWVPLSINWGNLRANGPMGLGVFKRVGVASRKYTDADVNITVAYNYETTPTTSKTWAAQDLTNYSVRLLEAQLDQAHSAASIAISVSDATPTGGPAVGTGRGFSVFGASALVGATTPKLLSQSGVFRK